MDGDYVARLLMGSCSLGLDFGGAGMDGGSFLDTLCGGGGGGFAERATRVSGGGSQFVVAVGSGGELGAASREGSSVSDPAWAYAGADGINAKKRKAPAGTGGSGKGKEAAACLDSCKVGEATGPDSSKRCKMEEGPVRPKVEETASDGSAGGERGQRQGKGKSSRPKPVVEPPKDYVHVRARRGQATDSHSLAERVRREKITQKMKILQDLVPGCNKVIGKALMLDEIINYVQSLQQQVEFLSMKLATVNPQLDFSTLSTLLQKDMPQALGPSMSSVFPLENAGAAFPFCDQAELFQSFDSGIMENQCSLGPLDTALPHAADTQYAFQKQQRDFWEEGLQNALHIGDEQSQENGVSAPDFDGRLQAADHTEIEF